MIDSVVAHLKADSTLSGLIAGRVSPMVRTSKGDAVTYHQIDDTDPTTLDLVKDVQTLEYQFEVFAKKHYVMVSIQKALKAALQYYKNDDFQLSVVRNAISNYEKGPKEFRCIMQVSFFVK